MSSKQDAAQVSGRKCRVQSDHAVPHKDLRGWLRFKPLTGWGVAIRNGRERKAFICSAFYFTKRQLVEMEHLKNRPNAIPIKVRISAGWKS